MVKKTLLAGLAIGLFMLGMTGSANAAIVWNWSFASEEGQFVTDGALVGGVAAPGTYNFSDFSVTSSATGGELGSYLGGTYLTAYFTDVPLSFDWDGSQVTEWNHSGSNDFDWWAFRSAILDDESDYFFGWNIGNINDYWSGAHYKASLGINNALAQGTISVAPAVVPLPSALLLFAPGLAGFAAIRRRLKK